MMLQHFSLMFLMSGLLFFAIYYLFALIYIHKCKSKKHLNFVVSCLGLSVYVLFELLLSLEFSDSNYLYFHKLKMVFAIIAIPFLQITIYQVYFPKGNKIVPVSYILIAPIFISLSWFDIFTSLPINEIVVSFRNINFIYHTGKANIIYSIFAICTFLVFLISALYYVLSKNVTKRKPFLILNIFGIILCANEYLLGHGLIKSIMLAEYFMFLFIFFIFMEFIKEDKFTYNSVLKLDTAKNYFLGLLSHELNTPLIGINGNAKLILEISEDAEIKECASYILESEARLRKFAELSLLITRIQTDKYQKSRNKECLHYIIEETIYNVRQKLDEKNILINKDLPADLFYISMDISLISKVFNIVISNAIKYSPQNSKIEILGKRISSTTFEVKIIDSGPGFSRISLENLFKLFSSTDDILAHSEGTGLSLAAAKVIMEFHGFEILVYNSSGGGAEIQMIFK